MMRTPTNQMTKSQSNRLFRYESGQLYYHQHPARKPFFDLNAPIGANSNGYRVIKYKQKHYKIHNLVWNWHHGEVPSGYSVDHINRDKRDNRIENLRLATAHQQAHNTSLSARNKTGIQGLSYNPKCIYRPWEARIKYGKKEYKSYHAGKNEAIKALELYKKQRDEDVASDIGGANDV